MEVAEKLFKLVFTGKRMKLAEVVEASKDLLCDTKPSRVLAAEEKRGCETEMGDFTEEVNKRLATEVTASAARLPPDDPRGRHTS